MFFLVFFNFYRFLVKMTNNNKKYKIGCFPGANPENGLISEIVKKAKSVNQFWDLAGSSLL